MQLVIDIGNTALKYGIYEQQQLITKGHDLTALTDALHSYRVSEAMIATVADSGAVVALLDSLHIPHSTLSAQSKLPISNQYLTPATLGSDRLAIAVAADAITNGAPTLSIGAGTAITYNFTDKGAFYGGAIAPGIGMRFKALNQFTARLPLVDWTAYRDLVYDELIGTDSESSIRSGVLTGVIQEVQGTIEQYRMRYSGLQVLITGGDMPFLVKNLKNNIFARPDMVLEGLNYILLYHA